MKKTISRKSRDTAPLNVNVMDVTLSEGIFKLKICLETSEEKQINVFHFFLADSITF